MQKENPVIKNYILSPEKFVLTENKIQKPSFGTYLYHELLKQNKVSVS